MNANDLARQILRFKSAWPRRCHWSDEEIGEQAAVIAKKIGWLTVENLTAVFTEMIARGNLNLEKLVKRAQEIQPYRGPQSAVARAEAESDLSPEQRRQGIVLREVLFNIWSRIFIPGANRPAIKMAMLKVFEANNMPQSAFDMVENAFPGVRAQKTPVEASKNDDPIQDTEEGHETPPVEAGADVSTNSGVQAGDGSEVEDDIPF